MQTRKYHDNLRNYCQSKNKECLIEFFFQRLKHVEKLSNLIRNIELFVSHGEMCHRFCTNNREEVQIEECEELFSDQEEADTRLLLHAKQASRTHNHIASSYAAPTLMCSSCC